MNDEDAFHALLDADPKDHHTRCALGDWLEERADPRAEGYRALGLLQIVPLDGVRKINVDADSGTDHWHYAAENKALGLAGTFKERADDILAAWLPLDWCKLISDEGLARKKDSWNSGDGWYGFHPTRRAMEDAAALAFALLPAERRNQLLTSRPPVLEASA